MSTFCYWFGLLSSVENRRSLPVAYQHFNQTLVTSWVHRHLGVSPRLSISCRHKYIFCMAKNHCSECEFCILPSIICEWDLTSKSRCSGVRAEERVFPSTLKNLGWEKWEIAELQSMTEARWLGLLVLHIS